MAVAGVRTHAIEDHRPSSPLGLNLNEYFVNQLNPKCEMPIPNPYFFFGWFVPSWLTRYFYRQQVRGTREDKNPTGRISLRIFSIQKRSRDNFRPIFFLKKK